MHQNLDMLTLQLSRLRQAAEGGACILVEGKRDEEALKTFGIDANFYHVSGSGLSINVLAEKISDEKEVVILTDFDKKGAVLASKVVEELHKCGKKVKVNLGIRRAFMNAMKTFKIGEVQDLKKVIGDDYNGESRRISHKVHNKGKARGNGRC